MNSIIILGLTSLGLLHAILATYAIPLDKIESSFLSQMRLKLRNEPELARCRYIWQAVNAKLHDLPDSQSQELDVNQINVRMFSQLRDIIQERRTGFGQNPLVPFLDDCIRILKENGAEDNELSSIEPVVLVGKANDNSHQADVHLKSANELEAENKRLLKEIENLKHMSIESADSKLDNEKQNEELKLKEQLASSESELSRLQQTEAQMKRDLEQKSLKERELWENLRAIEGEKSAELAKLEAKLAELERDLNEKSARLNAIDGESALNEKKRELELKEQAERQMMLNKEMNENKANKLTANEMSSRVNQLEGEKSGALEAKMKADAKWAELERKNSDAIEKNKQLQDRIQEIKQMEEAWRKKHERMKKEHDDIKRAFVVSSNKSTSARPPFYFKHVQ